jgi:hypothetical protein
MENSEIKGIAEGTRDQILKLRMHNEIKWRKCERHWMWAKNRVCVLTIYDRTAWSVVDLWPIIKTALPSTNPVKGFLRGRSEKWLSSFLTAPGGQEVTSEARTTLCEICPSRGNECNPIQLCEICCRNIHPCAIKVIHWQQNNEKNRSERPFVWFDTTSTFT